MGELIYSKKSHRKIFHLPDCKIIQRVSEENRCTLENPEQARELGYRICKCCPPTGQKYIREYKEIKTFCRNAGFTYALQDDEIHIISRYDCWKIITAGKKNEMFLYHKNTKAKRVKESQPVVIAGYHLQACRYESIVEYLEYIRSHDQYRELPRTINTTHEQEMPEWKILKYGEEYFTSGEYKRKKGTKAYKKAQKKRKREKRRVSIDRVYALLEGIAMMGMERVE